jgi:hypothetical protein
MADAKRLRKTANLGGCKGDKVTLLFCSPSLGVSAFIQIFRKRNVLLPHRRHLLPASPSGRFSQR